MASAPAQGPASEELLREQVRLLGQILGETVAELSGPEALRLVEELRRAALALRAGQLDGGRDAFAARVATLSLEELELLAGAFTGFFHLINAAEEQHRIRVLRGRDRAAAPPTGSLSAAVAELKAQGAEAADVQQLLDRMLVMPVLTAHPTEARRQTVRDHLAEVSAALDRLDDPRRGDRERALCLSELRVAVAALTATRTARANRPTPLDEVRSGLAAFERSLLDVTPRLYRTLEAALRESWPDAAFRVPSFLRWGTWIGGDRDGNRFVTAEITRAALSRQREVALGRARADVQALGRELSAWSAGDAQGGLAELAASLAADRRRLPAVAAHAQELYASEPWREKLRYVAARLEGALGRDEGGYPNARAYDDDLALLSRSLEGSGLSRLASGRLADARRRADVFGFHLATLDVRQHSEVHERAVAELLTRGGSAGYERLDDEERIRLLAGLLARAALPGVPDRSSLSPETREALDTLEVVGWARREIGPRACERYVVSFCSSASDLLEVLFLARAARLAPDELRPVPLLEQLEDLERGAEIAARMLDLEPLRLALGGELEVMVGYSDSGKQVGYVTSQVALRKAQLAIADVAQVRGATLTVFHGRGGAVGRGGGPARRAILAQPAAALVGRFRVTEQGETITARYGRPEIALRDLEQTVGAVMLASSRAGARGDDVGAGARAATADRAAVAALRAYGALVADPDRLARYAVAATPIEEIMQLRIASRPASRTQALSFRDLRAISWVFSWNQSRHGLPGWFGLGSALEAVMAEEGVPRAQGLYRDWAFFRALVDNARLALTQADLDVAAQYARLAPPDARGIFDLIRAEHDRTVAAIREVTGDATLMSPWPALASSAQRRNPYIDVVSHVQIELLARLRRAEASERDRVREVLFVAVNGIAAGLQSVG
jgi:phosphoenolpyruvate carboxylase